MGPLPRLALFVPVMLLATGLALGADQHLTPAADTLRQEPASGKGRQTPLLLANPAGRTTESADEAAQVLARVATQRNALQQRVRELEQRLAQEEAQRAATARLVEDNRRLQERARLLAEEVGALTQTNRSLQTLRDERWFAIGAGTLLTGLLAGFVLARLIHRRPSGGWA